MSREVLHIGMSESGATRVLRLTGELDSYTSDRLRGVSKTWIRGASKIVVNLDGLQYIDSSGLSALVGLWVEAGEHGAQMVVSCCNPRIHRVLEITGLLNLFNLDTGVQETRGAGAKHGQARPPMPTADGIGVRAKPSKGLNNLR